MTDAINNPQLTRHTALRKVALFCFVLISAFMITACQAKDKEMVRGLGVELFNYTQDSVYSVSINGNDTGVHWAKAAKIGSAMGGAVVCCSNEISALKNTASVSIKTNRGTYTTQALVELPFPDLMNTLVIHVLPGHKVVLEVTPGPSDARQDLMDAQIKALGLKKEVDETGFMRAERPRYTGYYKP